MEQVNYVSTVPVDAVPPGKAVVFEHAGHSILICHSGDRFFAVENKCSHADEVLACGRIRNGWIACPAHGARFDLETGAAMNPPARDPIRIFALRVSDGVIEVAL